MCSKRNGIIMFSKITAILLLLASSVVMAKELKAENESNGSIVISSDPCTDSHISEVFEYKSWATEDGKIIFNGCWTVIKQEENFIVIHWADNMIIKYPPGIFKD
jgi:hypothetical protein